MALQKTADNGPTDSPAWHALSVEEVLAELDTRANEGLDDRQVQLRRQRAGTNELPHDAGHRWWQLLATQFANLLVVILLAAAAVSFALGDAKDGFAILAIVVLNALLGFRQEYSAEKAIAALKKMAVPTCRARRNGKVVEVEARALVPGDLVLLEAGNIVPADGRLIECASLRTQEAALTGESAGVGKQCDAVTAPNPAVADRRNMVYMGTVVTYGRGEVVITATGLQSELGHVASLLGETEDEVSPLTRKIAHVGKVLIAIALGLISIIAVTGLLRGDAWKTVFLTAVSMAVAAVPEGLPAVVTIALALGARRMLARRALIRSLPAVETLGAVTAICTDKTGTLTQNVMTVTALELPDRTVDLASRDASEAGGIEGDDDARSFLAVAALCCDAVLEGDAPPFSALGDPTENALVIAAAEAGLRKGQLDEWFPRVAEAPFDSDRKRMSTCHALDTAPHADDSVAPLLHMLRGLGPQPAVAVLVKGAADSVLEAASRIRSGGDIHPLTPAARSTVADRAETLAANGLRVLAVAAKTMEHAPDTATAGELERDLVLLGLVAMMDPLRDEVKEAVQSCMDAGIRPIMITGDHPAMARSIAAQLNLPHPGPVMTGHEIQALDEAGLARAVRTTSVYARVSPEHKLRIIDALQANGEIVSMTGDGVNDAPALKSADIGVAMGVTGTDVAKGASDMILLDDRYNTIVAAVREGRVIFDNIRRFIRFILASNTGELLTMLLAPLFGMPLPLLPVQILWMNLVTDGLPALALGVEQGERDVMKRKPRDPKRPIIDWPMSRQILWIGLLMALLSLSIGYAAWSGTAQGPAVPSPHHAHAAVRQATTWQTMLFSTMVFAQLFLALAMRSDRESLFRMGVFSNRGLLLAVTVTTVLQFTVIYVPALQGFFSTTALTAQQLLQCVGMAALLFIAVELEKLIRRIVRKESA